jgi:uncharacterized protein YjbI with pentapeptide repeats
MYSVLLGAGVVGAALVYLVLVAVVPGADANRMDVAKTALLVTGGSGALAGLYVSYRKQRTDEASHMRDQDKLFTERYTQAAAQLGSEKAAVRLAGAYALGRIADDSERDRPTCLRVLCAYLRMPYDPKSQDFTEQVVRTTIQDVLAERLRPGNPGFWQDADIDLRDAHLIELRWMRTRIRELNLEGATFGGGANFDGAVFTGDAWFTGVTFTFYAELQEARFEAIADFDKAEFEGSASFRDAVFEGEASFVEARFLAEADFAGATFSEEQPPKWPDGFAA